MTMNKRNLSLMMCTLFSMPSVMMGQTMGWIDVTSEYVKNAGFDSNSNAGWTFTSDAWGQNLNYEAMEFWNGTFDIWQTVAVPSGKYRVSVQSYFRTGDNWDAYNRYTSGSDNVTGYLYANSDKKALANVYSESLSENIYNNCWTPGWGSQSYFPNGMASGSYCFGNGMYENSVETDVTDGMLRFGLVNEEWASNNWCMFDNFRLEYYGELVHISEIKVTPSVCSLVEGETFKIDTEVVPKNATFKTLSWRSNKTDVATVSDDGTVTALSVGTAVVTVEAKDGSGVRKSCIVRVLKNSADASSLVINEIQSANVDMFVDPSFNYGGWVELYNPTDKSASINRFYVSDDINDLKKFRLPFNAGAIPAGGFKNIWFDHNEVKNSQVNFKLDCDGGTIYISDEDGNLVAQQSYPAAVARTSYARVTDGAQEWGMTAEPTPQGSNAGVAFATERLSAPVVNHDSRFFTGALSVYVDIPEGVVLRYTTDGTTPTLANGKTSATGLFDVRETSIYRFRFFKDGMLPSEVVTRSFLYEDKDYKLPVISVVTDPVNLYDDSLGVYVKGVNGRTGNGQSTPCNWNMDWDRPVNFEYITTDGKMAVNQEVDFAMCGGWSRAWTPHSFKLKASKVYEGRNFYEYPFFADKPYLKHKTLQIRNGGNDTYCRIKDAALQTIVATSGIDIDGQAYQPTMHFINGQYIGVINMREPNNKHFAYANYGLDTEDIDQFEMSPDSGYCQMCGTEDSFLHWYDLSANAADDDVYEEIRQMVDIDEFISYMATEFWLGATDWPQNNVKGFKPKADGGKFRFVLFDLDGTFATTDPFNTFAWKQTYTFDYIYDTDSRITAEIKLVTIFLNMLKNDSFRKQFVDTYCLVGGSVFEPSRCTEIIDSLVNNVAAMMAYEGASPYGTANDLKSRLSNRNGTMIDALKRYSSFKLSSTEGVSVCLSSNIAEARLSVNGLPVPTGKFNGTLFPPVQLASEAPAGYRFVGWKNLNGDMEDIFSYGSDWEYYDKGSLDGKDWQSASYADAWSRGDAPLGFFTSDRNNERGYATFLDYGTNANSKRPTYYFKKTVTLDGAPSAGDVFRLGYVVDDGFIVYVNGTEAVRYNMPSGNVGFNTYSTTYAAGNPDRGSVVLPSDLFVEGENVIAVEVHNNSGNSTDIYWDACLSTTMASSGNGNVVCEEEVFDMPSNGELNLVACYERLSDEELAENGGVPVKVNEISGDNSIYINDYYKKNDWVELYNTTDKPVDVEGMYISDNISKLTKYRISAEGAEINTVIPPHGYLVIWCDKLVPMNQLHASFKLDKDGGCVVLSAPDEAWRDTLFYPLHNGDMSVGLYPDGGKDVYVMSKPTIGATNIMTSYAEKYDEPVIPNAIDKLYEGDEDVYDIAYYNGTIVVNSARAYNISLNIYTMTGQTCLTNRMASSDGKSSVYVGHLPSGVYVAYVKDEFGNEQTLKFIVKK